MRDLDEFFNTLWLQYVSITPQALAIHGLFEKQDECIVNDHVAFRTLAQSCMNIESLEPQILAFGYTVFDEYHFKQKKLYARSYVHPKHPAKIFLSELLWPQLSLAVQDIIKSQLDHINAQQQINLHTGRLWPLPSFQTYQTLLSESEYAAWFSIWGLRANHFTASLNHFKRYQNIADVLTLLNENGFAMNESGGLIKGQEQDCLRQASTLADKVSLTFKDQGPKEICSCYYEFAQRFKQKNGLLYQGFVTASADKIFESTHAESTHAEGH